MPNERFPILVEGQSAFSVTLRFSANLQFFLPRTQRGETLTKFLREKTSVKDVIESCGVPHPEVNVIRCDKRSVGFEHHLTTNARLEVFGMEDSSADGLQQRRLTSFVADGHLGKLARDLRLLGFDVVYSANATDAALVAISVNEHCALLTRDRRLLMHRVIRHGYCPRSHDPEEQTIEVIRRFDLAQLLAPYLRCLHCNGLLQRVEKVEVLEELEPLTKVYYEEFRRCADCRKIYWSGSHFGKLEARVARIRARLDSLKNGGPERT
ncbi:MAG: Mut7-C RNAse domain-containing protein [Chthoniobacterales bacterium]